MATLTLDKIDLHILRIMQEYGKLSNQELAELVGLSASPCSRRVKALEEAGYIAGYATLLSPEHFNLTLTAYVQVRLDKHSSDILDDFESQITGYDEVQECCLLTGSDADYQLKVLVSDMAHYKVFLLDKLTSIDHVAGVRSSFVLKQVKNQTRIPLPHRTAQ
ncbi:Lrp/AsnC family transcriptional regulator [Shewanella sp. NIFS-20-20]|uniref:Lrp/AsnC family transcriptional regulator n=1 Tax=Shewanella sp. NIFS-20-20 TaxID=2853806 RepID=UPI001C49260F|nr:Lrp/AsnC family transcriptional regulator [Shewanella sp. NIFS-20-20]MBV7316307.1 Lrp/AsnC family transcriptional regulator [Shewanella sp. NIFS-20-20]